MVLSEVAIGGVYSETSVRRSLSLGHLERLVELKLSG